MVLAVHDQEECYFSVQLIDLYTHNFDYIGSRATGNDGGSFLIAGPRWKGDAPKGVIKVIRSETELVLAPRRKECRYRCWRSARRCSAYRPIPTPAPPTVALASSIGNDQVNTEGALK